ncbi:MAG: DUF5946 family protein [Chloroflexota bacterium]|nr:DUF5946 family protein [Chloroflexota bacterium]
MAVVPCAGCGGLVPHLDGPTHRNIGASPGCWAIYGELLARDLPASEFAPLAVDAYAVQHPGEPGPQSTPSGWIHLIALHLVLESGWPTNRLIRIRTVGADTFRRWPWLQPPPSMGPITAVDVASGRAQPDIVERWVRGAWEAWSTQHPAVRERTAGLLG